MNKPAIFELLTVVVSHLVNEMIRWESSLADLSTINDEASSKISRGILTLIN